MNVRPRVRLRTLAVLGTATLGLTGLATFQTNRAFADPTEVYVAVGSDTTMDVVDQFGIDLTGNEVGSYDAVNPVTAVAHELITPVKAGSPTIRCSFTRPNGSGEGLAALRKSINQSTTAAQLTAPPQAGCIDIGRSSSGPASADASPTGALVYIPFALDAVTGATGTTTNITTADSFTLTDLINLYKNCTTVTEGGVTYNPGTATTGQVQINLYVPQSGSGTLKFWAATLGNFPTSPLPTCVHQTILVGPNAGTTVEEHNGLAVSSDPNGYMPFSIAQWISQRNGHNDRRHGAVLHNINTVSPFNNGNPATGSLNTGFPITREVYNIVQFSKVDPTSATKDPALISLLVGSSSFLCQDAFTLIGFGFAQLGTGTTDQCGSIANTLRVFDPTTDPV